MTTFLSRTGSFSFKCFYLFLSFFLKKHPQLAHFISPFYLFTCTLVHMGLLLLIYYYWYILLYTCITIPLHFPYLHHFKNKVMIQPTLYACNLVIRGLINLLQKHRTGLCLFIKEKDHQIYSCTNPSFYNIRLDLDKIHWHSV